MRRQVSSVNRFEHPFCARRISSVTQNRLASTPMNPLVLGEACAFRQHPTRAQEGPQPLPVNAEAGGPATQGRTSKHRKARRGTIPPRAPPGAIEKRPPRARRPALPQPRAAVLSAKAGLTAGFGMGPGDPRLCGRARGGRSPAAQMYSSLPGTPCRGDPGGRMAGTAEDRASRSVLLIEDAKSSGY